MLLITSDLSCVTCRDGHFTYILICYSFHLSQTRLKQNQLPQEAPPTTNPAHQPHPQHPVFGVQQTASVLESSERERAKVFFLDQLSMVEEKQRRVREKALKTLQQESQMLKTTKEGCVMCLSLVLLSSYLILVYWFLKRLDYAKNNIEVSNCFYTVVL